MYLATTVCYKPFDLFFFSLLIYSHSLNDMYYAAMINPSLVPLAVQILQIIADAYVSLQGHV